MTHDVVAEAPAAKGEPILTFVIGDAFQFFYVVLPRPIVRVGGENGNRAPFGRRKVTVCL